MQVITVGSTAQDLCTKLASVAVPGFFDSVEMADGSSTVAECKKNGTALFKIEINAVVTCTFPNGASYPFPRSEINSDYIDLIVATSKAIYIKNHLGNGTCVVISKDTDGSIAIMTCIYSGAILGLNGDTKSVPISIFKEDGSVIVRMYSLNNDNLTKKSFFIPLIVEDDLFIDGVYIALIRPYPFEPGYMPFTIGSTEYVGFGGTSLIAEA
jgi:hypothetical protein